MSLVTIGLDVGQRRDNSVCTVAEHQMRPNGKCRCEPASSAEWSPYIVPSPDQWFRCARCLTRVGPREHFNLRRIWRWPLHTEYGSVSEDVYRIWRQTAVHHRVLVMVDATGIGLAVVDLVAQMGVPVMPVHFVSTDKVLVRNNETVIGLSVGVEAMVGRLISLYGAGRVHLSPQNQYRAELEKQMRAYGIEVDDDGKTSWGARGQEHDDFVVSVGLATLPSAEGREWRTYERLATKLSRVRRRGKVA